MRIARRRIIGILLVIVAVVAFSAFYFAGLIVNLLSSLDEVLVTVVAAMIIAGTGLIYWGKQPETRVPPPSRPEMEGTGLVEQLRQQNERAAAERRRQRYARLNESVFIPLREYRGSSVPSTFDHDPWNQLKFSYDLSQIRGSAFFEECAKHLQQEAPGVISAASDIESRVTALNNSANDYRNRTATSKVREALEIVFEDRRDVQIADSYTNRPNQAYLPGLMNFLGASWINPVMYYDAANYALDSSLVNRIVEARDDFSSHFEDQKVIIEGTHVATLPTEALRESLVRSVKELRKNVIVLQGIVDLARTKRELIKRIDDEVRNPLKTITNLIESERYTTVCEDCHNL